MVSEYNLTRGQIKALTRHNSPTIANAMGVLSQRKKTEGFNRDPVIDFMPETGAMCGYAVTLQYQASKEHNDWAVDYNKYLKWMDTLPEPKIVVLQDLDAPDGIVGSFWGECNANKHRALGCIGTITDGAVRDLSEMKNAGFKALARRLCVAPAYGKVVDFGNPASVFGCEIKTGDLIHADPHGFITIPPDVAESLDKCCLFYDRAELEYIITVARKKGVTVTEMIENEQKFMSYIKTFSVKPK